MARRREFVQQTRHQREQQGGLRHYARATKAWVEAQPSPTPTVVTPSGVYEQPGRGQNGESSN